MPPKRARVHWLLASLLFESVAWLVLFWTAFCFRSLLLLISRYAVFCFQPCLSLVDLDVPLSCRLTRLHLITPAFVFGERSVLTFGRYLLFASQIFFCSLKQWNNRNLRSVRLRARTLSCLVFCFARFWWRVLLSCRLTRLDLNSIQFSFAFKDGVLRRLHGRVSSFKTSPGRFRRIIAMSKSVVGDVSTRTTPGVALWGGKPRRKYFCSLHLTRWTDHFEPKTSFILAVYRINTSSAVLLKSRRLQGIVWMHSCPFSNRFELYSRVNNLRHRHIYKTHHVSRVYPEPGNVQGACIGCFLPVRWKDIAIPKAEPRSGSKWTAPSVIQDVNQRPSTVHIGFRTPEGQLKVRRLTTCAVVDSCPDWIVETCVLIERRCVFDLSNLRFFRNSGPWDCYSSLL